MWVSALSYVVSSNFNFLCCLSVLRFFVLLFDVVVVVDVGHQSVYRQSPGFIKSLLLILPSLSSPPPLSIPLLDWVLRRKAGIWALRLGFGP